MNSEIHEWIEKVRKENDAFFKGKRIFEGGSQDVNGNVRDLFQDAVEYVGVDAMSGKHVDVVCNIHKYKKKPTGYFDVCLYLNTLSYDPSWKLSLKKMVNLLKDGGVLIMTTPTLTYNPEFQMKYLLGWELPMNPYNYFRIKTVPEIKDCVFRYATFESVMWGFTDKKYIFKGGIFSNKGKPCKVNIDDTYVEIMGAHTQHKEF